MDWLEHVKKDSIFTLHSTNKIEAIKELTDLLKRKRKINDQQKAERELLFRESLESTALGHGIAMPHTTSTAVTKLICSVGILNDPIDFRSFDGQPVKLIFLILYPKEEQTSYLSFVASLAGMLQETEWRENMLKATSPEELYAILVQAHGIQLQRREAETALLAASAGDQRAEAAIDRYETDISLLVRLQTLQELTSRSKRQSKTAQSVQQLRSCIPERALSHFDALFRRHGNAVVPIEGLICQGCHMRLATTLVQRIATSDDIITCPHCRRFLYMVSKIV